MKLHVDVNRKKRLGYKHANKQAGWTDASSRVGYNKNQLQDEEYAYTLSLYNPLWRYIINRFPKEDQSPVVVLGYSSIPFAIELSQWTYPVTYITDSFEGVKKAQRDCEIQAGFFNKFLYFNYLKNCPHTRLTIFIGILEHLDDDQCIEFLDLLLRRSREVICAVPLTRDWNALFAGKYNYNMIKYSKEGYYILNLYATQSN